MAKWIGRRAYRCINCGWRGILKLGQGSIIRRARGREKFKPLHVIIVIIVTLIAVAAILYWLNREPEKPLDIALAAGLILPIRMRWTTGRSAPILPFVKWGLHRRR